MVLVVLNIKDKFHFMNQISDAVMNILIHI